MMCSRGLALAAALLLAASHVTAQALRGTVVDSTSGLPLAGAHVTVLDGRGAMVADAVTGAAGSFTFRLPGFGAYQVRARRIGYASRITDPIAVDSTFAYSIQVVLRVNPVPLDTLRVVAEKVTVEKQVPWLADAGFYDRRRKGFGHFLDREEIEKKHPLVIADLLEGMPGVEVHCSSWRSCCVAMAGSRMFILKGCAPTVVLDGVPISGGVDALDVFNLEAIEVYPSPAGLPVQYSGYLSPCGAILLWARR
jgi:hypothetical protein